MKSWLIGKDSDVGRDWGQEEKGTIEDEMAGWHHWLDGCESEWTPGDGDGQGGLACCNSWGCKELDMTERLNWTEHNTGQEREAVGRKSLAMPSRLVCFFPTLSLLFLWLHLLSLYYVSDTRLNALHTSNYLILTITFQDEYYYDLRIHWIAQYLYNKFKSEFAK